MSYGGTSKSLKSENMKFNVVGDVYGGLWALENREAQVFLVGKIYNSIRMLTKRNVEGSERFIHAMAFVCYSGTKRAY